MLDFFHHFNGIWHVDEVDDQSMTIDDSVRPLFDDSYYALSIIDNFYANTMNYSRQQNSTERFLYFIGRHKAEFHIPIGTQTVQVRNKVGVRRNDVLIHEDDNLVDFNITTDTGSFCTAIKGYYRFRESEGEDTEKMPTREYDYISPMADKYGIIWGEPIWDERFDTLEGIKAACQEKQESTWKSSFEISAKLFKAPLGIGDEVPFVVPSKGINGYIRVVEINEEFDEEGDLIAASYVFGNENIASQYRKMQYDAIQDVHDILNGRKPIPFSVLPKAVREATAIINAGDTTQFYYRDNGIYGYNTENTQWVVRMNANGLGYSTDGGQNYSNAITHLGVVTEALTAGTIDANRITIYGSNGTNRIEIDGDKIKVWDSTNPDAYTEMTRDEFHAHKTKFKITAKDGRIVMEDGLMRGGRFANINPFVSNGYLGPGGGSDIYFDGMSWIWPGDTGRHIVNYLDDQYYGRFVDFRCAIGIRNSSASSSSRIKIEFETWDGTIVGGGEYTVQKGTEPLRQETIRLDLQSLYGAVPDYRTIFLYASVEVTGNQNVDAVFRINRGEHNG